MEFREPPTAMLVIAPTHADEFRALFTTTPLGALAELDIELAGFEPTTYTEDWDELLAVAIGPLLDGRLTPHLTTLRLHGLRSESVSALLPILARSALLPHLRVLVLGEHPVSPRSLGAAFHHLRELSVPRELAR